ncbi:MAG TPA: hypothetical protein VF210_18610 [Pseudomonadales bacterium]
MKPVKRTDEYVIYRKRNQRYAVRRRRTKEWVLGEEKVAVLLANGLMEPPARRRAEEAAGEVTAEAGAEGGEGDEGGVSEPAES